MTTSSASSNNELETLKMKLKYATKTSLNKEKELGQARNRENGLNEQLMTLKSETHFLKQELEEVKTKIAKNRHHLSVIKIYGVSKKCKNDAHVQHLRQHFTGFQNIFDKERGIFELRMKDLKEKEAAEEEELRQEELRTKQKNEQTAREAASVAAECDALEKECSVLKKRNHATMIILRRKLLETEKARRELANKNDNLSGKA